MPLRPGLTGPRSKFDICLDDSRSADEWYLKLEGSVERSSFSPESLALDIRAQGKRVGDFDEQRSWKGGALSEYFSEDPSAFYDSRYAWTLSHHLIPAPKWYISTGAHRAINENAGDNVRFLPLIGTNRYVEDEFTATAQTADYVRLWVRKRGNPGTLTMELCADSAGSPDTVLKTVTKASTDISDWFSHFLKFDWTSTQALSGATAYHVKVYGASTDNDANHWEIGIDPDLTSGQFSTNGSSWNTADYGLHYRIADADVAGRWYFWSDGTLFFKVKGATAYVWNETDDDWDAAGGTPGLTAVAGRPVYFNGSHYFPQGESTNIRRWDGTTTWADDGTNKATFLTAGFDSADGPVIWRANTAAGTTSSVSRAKVPATNLVFNTAINIGDIGKAINGIYFWTNNGLVVIKSDSFWTVASDRAIYKDFGLKNTPSSTNGVAIAGHNHFLYWNWLFSLAQVYGDTNSDIGVGWRNPALPNGRDGYISSMTTLAGWLIYSIDAGAYGTSSVWIFDGLAHHEIWRAYDVGVRVRDIATQPVSGARTRIWIDCGVDTVYMEFPLNKANPLNDAAFKYHHEFVLDTSTIDMGTASKLPKYISELTATTANLNGAGIKVDAYYQVDEDIGSSSNATWIPLDAFITSPEQSIEVNRGDITQIRFRIIGQTDDADTPPVIKGVVPNGFARTNFKLMWSMRVVSAVANRQNGADALDRWLMDVARFPGRVRMTSTWENLHDYHVIIAPPRTTPIRKATNTKQEASSYVLTLMEI